MSLEDLEIEVEKYLLEQKEVVEKYKKNKKRAEKKIEKDIEKTVINPKCSDCKKLEKLQKNYSSAIRKQNKIVRDLTRKSKDMSEKLLKQIFTLEQQLKKKKRGDFPLLIYRQDNIDERISGPFGIVEKEEKN